MRSTYQRPRRHVPRTPARAFLLVGAATLSALGLMAALALARTSVASVAEASGPIDAAVVAPAAVPVNVLVPPPPLPDRIVPDLPLRQAAPATPTPKVRYTCEPNADARFDDPDSPGLVTNKSCPDANAAEERSHREFAEQQRSAEPQQNEELVGDHRESTCSDPSSADYGTAACGTDADGDGLMDGGPLDTG